MHAPAQTMIGLLPPTSTSAAGSHELAAFACAVLAAFLILALFARRKLRGPRQLKRPEPVPFPRQLPSPPPAAASSSTARPAAAIVIPFNGEPSSSWRPPWRRPLRPLRIAPASRHFRMTAQYGARDAPPNPLWSDRSA